MSGQNNYLGMVTSQEMIENEMGYRGSKSEFIINNPQPKVMNSVKEQRVDGGYCINPMQLRCTLAGFERNYHIKIPSKQLNQRTFTTLNNRNVLNPWFITGFTDAEACFSIGIRPDAKLKTKWRVLPVFIIKLHKKDLTILELIKNTLLVGKIRTNGVDSVQYVVESFKELQVILNHFDTYPLVTAKLSDYLIFKQCLEIINNGEHLTEKGLLKIVGLKSSLNWGLSSKLLKAFPNVIPVNIFEYKFNLIPDPFWVAGFTSGDGSFHLKLRRAETNIGYRVSLIYSFHLHIRDLDVLKGLCNYFNNYFNQKILSNEKRVYTSEKNNSVHLQITNFTDILEKIIPFFDKYPVIGIKSLDFEDFKKVCSIVKSKKHLTPEGIQTILEIKSNMNQNRTY
jgi:LAGLIDADG endonuclease.